MLLRLTHKERMALLVVAILLLLGVIGLWVL
jgi:MFS-type transporter involved in bile tolerance (Atg22 family)